MKKRKIKELLALLESESINTWFDLGLFIDRFKEERKENRLKINISYAGMKEKIRKSGMAFLTFGYSVDGVTIEILKYAKIFARNLEGIDIHLIGGHFKPESYKLIDESYRKFSLAEMEGFDDWSLYNKFFFVKLERGSSEYNQLILDFWDHVIVLVKKLGDYIEKEDISLFYLVNVASNPGNIALTMALVLITEYLELPVINNNHDFYWEGGNSEVNRRIKDIPPGPRDFFFTNSHLGEIFSIIEVLYPWESRSWMNVNINKEQVNHLMYANGHNPANISELGTAVDMDDYKFVSKRVKINTFHQFEKILSKYENTLISYSVDDVINNRLIDESNPRPILLGKGRTKPCNHFLAENIVFLQPTRIIGRKRIETGFRLIEKLFTRNKFRAKFKETENLKLTMLVTGPIATGHFAYFEKLLERFNKLVSSLDKEFREKVYLAFIFSELDKERFKKKFKNPVTITDLYKISSLILLPSETEGRGLPIIESAAGGIPIFCRRYYPEHVYSHVIGEHLPEEERLQVIEYDGKLIRPSQLDQITDMVFFPHMYSDVFRHNQLAVNKRYSLDSLNQNLRDICQILYYQLRENDNIRDLAIRELKSFIKRLNSPPRELKELMNTDNRQYMAGFGKQEFMLNLKSLIDPSAFRMEEQEMRGRIFNFAQETIQNDPDKAFYSETRLADFYNAIDEIFIYHEGEYEIQHDHSFAYRHRNRKKYPFRELTYQEMTGLVSRLYYKILEPVSRHPVDSGIHFFTDWNLALSQLAASDELCIDDRDILISKMQDNIIMGIFSGKYVKHELEFFVLQALRSRYKLSLEQELTEEILLKSKKDMSPIYLFIREKSVKDVSSAQEVVDFIEKGEDRELKLILKHGLLRIIMSRQCCVGIHFALSGSETLRALIEIKKQKGIIISHHRNAAVMTDIIDIDRIHIDRVEDLVTASIMGIPEGSGYIQFVPAGVRPTLSYPTPVQTALDFHKALKSEEFRELAEEMGEEELYNEIKKDAVSMGTPLMKLLVEIKSRRSGKKEIIKRSYISGVYPDGMPWSGACVRSLVTDREKTWKYIALSAEKGTKTVSSFIKEFEERTGKRPEFAWNGGYILNPELVGKLGLSESYIGSPLGLLISDSKLISAALFNKPALLVDTSGKVMIRRVSSSRGFTIRAGDKELIFPAAGYNLQDKPAGEMVFYDLMYDKEKFPADGRIIIRLAGNKVMEIIKGETEIKSIPVGLTLSFSEEVYSPGLFKEGDELDICLTGFEDIQYAVEAGPLLVDKGKVSIDMEEEGWKTNNSIRTQAARLDYTDMRGPKIAAGVDAEGNLVVLTVNGRIRESVGATHGDMASILVDMGIQQGMGFDPGGSSTLVAGDEVMNISPYNKNYEENIYALPPQPRAVANAVVAIYE